MSRRYVVTGANRGLGLEFTRQLVERGAQVIATARSPGRAEALEGLGVRVEALDVGSAGSVAELAHRLDGAPVDVLINNAAVQGGQQSMATLDLGVVQRCFEVNSLGPIRVVQALLDNLRGGESKLIVNITSQLGSLGLNFPEGRRPVGGYTAYRTSKAALNMLTQNLARELGGEGFTCVLLHPGWVRTDMGGPHAPVSPRDSVRGMLRVLDRVSPDDNGRFLDFEGKTLPW